MKKENNMKKEFIERVQRERIVDTKTYRYIAKEVNGAEQHLEIRRTAISNLDTTAVLDSENWEVVAIIK